MLQETTHTHTHTKSNGNNERRHFGLFRLHFLRKTILYTFFFFFLQTSICRLGDVRSEPNISEAAGSWPIKGCTLQDVQILPFDC